MVRPVPEQLFQCFDRGSHFPLALQFQRRVPQEHIPWLFGEHATQLIQALGAHPCSGCWAHSFRRSSAGAMRTKRP